MNTNSPSTKKKYKKPKHKTKSTTVPPKTQQVESGGNKLPVCPLLAKDSEWVDFSQSSQPVCSNTAIPEEEEGLLQLVDCEDGPELKPLAIMFPALLEKDPETLQEMLSKVMSTTEVTRQLVNLGQKANFASMNNTARLIPQDKVWLESVAENTNTHCSNSDSTMENNSFLSDYDADTESSGGSDAADKKIVKVKKSSKNHVLKADDSDTAESYCANLLRVKLEEEKKKSLPKKLNEQNCKEKKNFLTQL